MRFCVERVEGTAPTRKNSKRVLLPDPLFVAKKWHFYQNTPQDFFPWECVVNSKHLHKLNFDVLLHGTNKHVDERRNIVVTDLKAM